MAESATATDVSPAERAALKEVALEGGLSETKVSCAALGDRLDASTQTASRRLQQLEAGDLIEREVVGDGQWVTITDAGEAYLRGEYADYRRLFETDTELRLSGTVTSGMGEGRHYITLDGYMTQFRERLGYEPFPGTLNVELDEKSVRRRGEFGGVDAIPIDGWEDEERTFGAATCYAVTIAADDGDGPASDGDGPASDGDGPASDGDGPASDGDGPTYEDAHVIIPDRTHHDESQLEVIAPDRLRDELDLADGETIALRVTPDTRADEESV